MSKLAVRKPKISASQRRGLISEAAKPGAFISAKASSALRNRAINSSTEVKGLAFLPTSNVDSSLARNALKYWRKGSLELRASRLSPISERLSCSSSVAAKSAGTLGSAEEIEI